MGKKGCHKVLLWKNLWCSKKNSEGYFLVDDDAEEKELIRIEIEQCTKKYEL